MNLTTLVALIFACFTAVNTASLSTFNKDLQWSAWKTYHRKIYNDDFEESFRHAIWLYNLKKIEEHNKVRSFKLAINHLGDYTTLEYRHLLLGSVYNPYMKRTGSTFLPPSNVKLNATVDWRQHGYVTPVKNQGQCGSCWAFSTTGSLEGQHFKKTGELVSLSEQNLVDCSSSYGNHGCNGGLMDNAFNYIKANGGIDTEASYLYTAKNGDCKFSESNVGATCTGHVDVTKDSEKDLKSAVATVGPVSVAIDASHFSFQFYHSGVYDEPFCSSTKLDHGVLVVGYGEYNSKDYWLVKNSWGDQWGLQGYIRMTRNSDNQCGIATDASYPLV